MQKRINSLLSLCQKASRLVSGEVACEKALQSTNAKLVIIATDASDNTKKKFINKSFYYKVDSLIYSTKEELARCIGKQNCASIVIIDENFAKKLKDLIENTTIL